MSLSKCKWLFILIMAFAFVGCNTSGSHMQAFKYHENARRRAVVAILPVISKVDNYLPWDLSEEFTCEIQKRLGHHSEIYLNSVDIPVHLKAKLEASDSIALDKKDFHEMSAQNDFAVILELIEHSETPFSPAYSDVDLTSEPIDRILNMKMRVKVLDLRAANLKVVLHEIFPLNHQIPREYSSVNYDRVVWGSDAYPATAYGRAHAKLEKEISRQIENYISIAH